jgi:hypothetical protein
MHGPQSGSPAVVDAYYQQYEDYEDEFPDQRRVHNLFGQTLGLIRRILPDIRGTRWSNKTDFYTLFVALSSLLKSNELPSSNISRVRRRLERFAVEVDERLGDPNARVSREAIAYARAHEKGANDKVRRAHRHDALIRLIQAEFKPSTRRP